ncbi:MULTISPECIES: phage tail protein [Brevibacillus]|uniref:phage tail protein n=1 Tax=Brevibacillus TaxID=55080 RepID=UPI0004F35D10|nr:phage tail protein [Brevibacillus borstelensis]KKX52565.1 phage tail protein [Brevibacillus borstelensis cifa_chp40]
MILRGVTSLAGYPPGVYVNEMAVPQSDDVKTSDFVPAFIGEFDRGPVNQYVLISETPTTKLYEVAGPVLGLTTKPYAGNALLDHLKHAKIRKAAFIRVLGEGHATASLVLNDRQETPAPTLKVSAKYPGEYANIFTVEVADSSAVDTFKLILVSDFGTETYDNLSMDKSNTRYAVKVVNASSEHFYLEDLNSGAEPTSLAMPAVKSKTQLTGGNNGAPVTDADRIGSYDPGTGKRTGLKLLEVIGNIVTDVAHINYSSQTTDDAIVTFGEKNNCSTYIGTNTAQTVDDAITYRNNFDSDFGQMAFGYYRSATGQRISGACLSAIVHVMGNVEDSGLAVECGWIVGTDQELGFDDYSKLFQDQITAFQLKPSAAGDGSLAWRMANDYTLAKTDVAGDVISDNENRKVNKRRLNSWIEKQLETVAAPWQGRAMTRKMRDDAERRIRTFFDKLVVPGNPAETSKIEAYSIAFNYAAKDIDQFVQDIKVKHYNTAEWILLNFMGGTNVEVDV